MSGIVVCLKRGVKARKQRDCFWCGEPIDVGQLYDHWTWIDDIPERISVHPECRDAWNEAADDEGGFYETMPGEHARGCRCERNFCECGAGVVR